jgi:PTS system N-acetylgalactosamine-specific IIA component
MTSSAPEAAARRAIVAGHGEFAAGMISALQAISGKGELFLGVSNRDLSAAALEETLRGQVDALRVRVIFTDLPAGSCTIAARRVARDHDGLVVVTGANLSVLLGWALAADDGPAACERALERGRGAMGVVSSSVPAEGRGAN